MANANTLTLLSLDHYAEILGLNPVHFNSVLCNAFPETPECRDLWMQHAWQLGDKASREDLARAIAQAEQMIADQVGYWPAPKWTAAEDHLYPKQGRMSDGIGPVFYPALSLLRWKTVQTKWMRLTASGRRRVVLIEADAAVNYSDPNGDGFKELATVTSSYQAADPSEIAVFRPGCTDSEKRIRPLKVTVADEAVTIQGHSALFVDPDLWERSEAVDGDDSDSFLKAVDVCRVYTEREGESCAPVVFYWQKADSVALAACYGMLQHWEPVEGIMTPIPVTWTDGEWKISSWCVRGEPDLLQLWYKSGWPAKPDGRMSEPWARAVAALATALLVKPVCGCGRAEKLAGYWQDIPADERGVWGSYEQLNCPFGPQRGAWEAWKTCQAYMEAEGASL